jgi:hypothetical protein
MSPDKRLGIAPDAAQFILVSDQLGQFSEQLLDELLRGNWLAGRVLNPLSVRLDSRYPPSALPQKVRELSARRGHAKDIR